MNRYGYKKTVLKNANTAYSPTFKQLLTGKNRTFYPCFLVFRGFSNHFFTFLHPFHRLHGQEKRLSDIKRTYQLSSKHPSQTTSGSSRMRWLSTDITGFSAKKVFHTFRRKVRFSKILHRKANLQARKRDIPQKCRPHLCRMPLYVRKSRLRETAKPD